MQMWQHISEALALCDIVNEHKRAGQFMPNITWLCQRANPSTVVKNEWTIFSDLSLTGQLLVQQLTRNLFLFSHLQHLWYVIIYITMYVIIYITMNTIAFTYLDIFICVNQVYCLAPTKTVCSLCNKYIYYILYIISL